MAAAYAYADGGRLSPEIEALKMIDRFGAQAVYGRPLGIGEMRRLLTAERIVKIYVDRAEFETGYANWGIANPDAARILERAYIAARDEGLLNG